MDPMTIALISSAVLGMAKGQEQQFNAKQQGKVEATREKWAPFTGRRGQSVARPSSMDPMMQALLTGAMIGQQFKGGAGAADPAAAAGGATGVGPAGTPMANAAPYNGGAGASPATGDMGFNAYAQQNYTRPYAG